MSITSKEISDIFERRHGNIVAYIKQHGFKYTESTFSYQQHLTLPPVNYPCLVMEEEEALKLFQKRFPLELEKIPEKWKVSKVRVS